MTDAFPPVSELPEAAAGTLLGVFSKLAELHQPALARWAEAVGDVLLARLVWLTTNVKAEPADTEPVPLSTLDAAELEGLHWVLVATAAETDDSAARGWLTELGRMILADFERRIYEQAVIDAKADAIDAEEQRIAREKQPPPNTNGLPPWSQASSEPPELM